MNMDNLEKQLEEIKKKLGKLTGDSSDINYFGSSAWMLEVMQLTFNAKAIQDEIFKQKVYNMLFTSSNIFSMDNNLMNNKPELTQSAPTQPEVTNPVAPHQHIIDPQTQRCVTCGELMMNNDLHEVESLNVSTSQESLEDEINASIEETLNGGRSR